VARRVEQRFRDRSLAHQGSVGFTARRWRLLESLCAQNWLDPLSHMVPHNFQGACTPPSFPQAYPPKDYNFHRASRGDLASMSQVIRVR
jgi:hypothetical protein